MNATKKILFLYFTVINQCLFKCKHVVAFALVLNLVFLIQAPIQAATALADQPLFAASSVPGNVAIAISAEFPTALGSAYTGSYNNAVDYIGYFDFQKCYIYHGDPNVELRYFQPVVAAVNHQCAAQWSGNFLNYALTQTIDPFRKALSGGYRSVDTVNLTVLEKAYASGQGGGVNTPSITANATLYTPFPWASLNVRIAGLGKGFNITGNGNLNNPGLEINGVMPVNPPTTNVYFLYARANVCVIGQLEDNCTQYGTNYKSTGLIQKNSAKLNFAMFGYLNNADQLRDGGVLRAAMGQVGPLQTNPNAASTVNPKAEWDANTGIFNTNPDPNTATASGVTNSGVINYLNKFGLTAQSYKTYDSVSELYYTASRYYRNKGNVTSYTNNLTAAQIDGFPVITNWADPVKYSCQANFIIGIGDTNTWYDGNLPGSIQRANEPAIPPEVVADLGNGDMSAATTQIVNNLNVTTATNRIGAMQGIGNTLTTNFTGASGATYLMGGMAYDLHTRDMRPDFAGLQTVTTYWLDVLESGFRNDGGTRFNAFYLAAKYGGFEIPAVYDPYSAVVTPLTVNQWDKNGDGDPDNYFRANNPALMITSLNTAFDNILKSISGSSTAFSVPSPSITDGSMSYAASYVAKTWTGDVTAYTLNVANSTTTSTLAWHAVDSLEAQTAGTGWDSGRFIATANCSAAVTAIGTQNCVGVPFRLGSLTAAQKTALGAATNQQGILNFLRGDISNEGTAGLKLRDRNKVLGDIVDSKVKALGKPNEGYSDAYNPGYSAFKSNNANRATVAYVNANDGFLHAFNGASNGGNELFAYLPNADFLGPNNTPAVDGITQLSSPNYVHKYYSNATPVVRDVNFGGGSGDWHSLLVSGLGKGGKSYYAIDVTNPSSMSNEANLAANVKWEFTHINMGYGYARPLMTKTAKYGWVVILTSGYNNSDGNGYFFIVRPQDGLLLETIPLNDPHTGDAGLAHVAAFAADTRSNLADAAYAGDLLGNVWRLDLTGTGAYPAPVKIAQLKGSDGIAQPITTIPVVQVDNATLKRYVLVGTGRLLDTTDVASTQQQTFYAINDGTRAIFNTSATLPAGLSFPITRSNLNDDTATLTTGIGTNPANPMGYFVDLGFSGGVPYRINVEMASGLGGIAFISNLTSGDACNPSGSFRGYILSYGTGQSKFRDVSSNLVPYVTGTGLGVDATVTDLDGGNTGNANFSGSDGKVIQQKIDQGVSQSFQQLNWRELPSIQ